MSAVERKRRLGKRWAWRGGRKRSRSRHEEILPPEGVPIRFHVSSLVSRAGAQMIDVAVTMGFVIAVIALMALALDLPGTLIVGVGALLWFAIRTPYYIATELLWNGVTLGKRMLRIRVISADGKSLTPHGVVVRNLMKEAEVFAPITVVFILSDLSGFWQFVCFLWIAVSLAVPLANRRRQRLGDIMGGTFVVNQPAALLLPDLAAQGAATAERRHVFLPNQLDHYGVFELQTLETFLQLADRAGKSPRAVRRRREQAASIVEKIRAKIDYPEAVAESEVEAFLRDFYVAQRKHLEQRQLLGDRRADKFHAEQERAPTDPDRTDRGRS